MSRIDLLILDRFQLIPAFTLCKCLQKLLRILFICFKSKAHGSRLLRPVGTHNHNDVGILFQNEFGINRSRRLNNIFCNKIGAADRCQGPPCNFAAVCNTGSFRSFITCLNIDLRFRLADLIDAVSDFCHMICIKLLEFCRAFLFAQRLADGFNRTLMILKLFRMIINIDCRYAGCIELRLHIGFILLFHVQRDKDDIRIQRNHFFRVEGFFVHGTNERNLFQFRKIRFEMIPHIGTILTQGRINPHNEIGDIFARQSRHRQKCTARSTPLHNNTFCRLFQCDLLSCDIRNLNRLVILCRILFHTSRASAGGENHADQQKKNRSSGKHILLCLKYKICLKHKTPHSLNA